MIRENRSLVRAPQTTVPKPKVGPTEEGCCIFKCSVQLGQPDGGELENILPLRGDVEPTMKSADQKPVPDRSDESLVTATLRGDKEAYRNLVERYQSRLLSMAADVLKSREDAEDVVQEAFVKAYLSLGGFKGQSSFYTWLYRIAFNMAVDVRRKTARRGGAHVEFKEGIGVNNAATGDGDTAKPVSGMAGHLQNVEGPHDAMIRKETGKTIERALGELSDEHREVIVLREVDGLNYEEIAEAIGVPRGTVMSRLHYARKALQKALRDYAPAFLRSQIESDKEEDGELVINAAKGSTR